MAMVSAGRILIIPRGEWDNATTYKMLDLVTGSNKTAYLCKSDNLNIDPTTDTTMTYWQPFGTTLSVDGETIIQNNNDVISVNIDGTSIFYDQNDNVIHVALSTLTDVDVTNLADGKILAWNQTASKWEAIALSNSFSGLTDVSLTNLQNGQVAKYNSTSQKWENGDVAAALSGLTDTDILNLADNQILTYDSTDQKWENKAASSTLSLSDAKPIQGKVVAQTLAGTLETIGSTASMNYASGDVFVATDGYVYRATTAITSGNTLVIGGNCEATSIKAQINSLKKPEHGIYELWANPNITSAFSEQDVYIANYDVNVFDGIFIVYAPVADEAIGTVIVEVDNARMQESSNAIDLKYPNFNPTVGVFAYYKRSVAFGINTSTNILTVHFGVATGGTLTSYGTAVTMSSLNQANIPVRILGIRHNS